MRLCYTSDAIPNASPRQNSEGKQQHIKYRTALRRHHFIHVDSPETFLPQQHSATASSSYSLATRQLGVYLQRYLCFTNFSAYESKLLISQPKYDSYRYSNRAHMKG